MQAATKAGTLGVSSMMLATATHFGDLGVTARALLTVAFVFATAPVAAHLIGRVAYIVGAEMWHGTVIDELRSRYEARRRGIGEFDDAPTPPGTGGGSSDRIREENPD
jgi:multicomponent Na+:H+ antiporter subunit G